MPDGRHLGRSDHPLAKAVFASVYRSREQRSLRLLAQTSLVAKHTLLGSAPVVTSGRSGK
ncbi:MAG: hypothetical protein AAB252_01010 [Pseudomonadota bacterium]